MPNALLREPSDWATGNPVLQAELSALDLALASAVNGEGGGTYVQGAGGTTIGGAGVWFAASLDHAVAGSGALIYPTGGTITHADADYTVLTDGHPSRTRSLVTPILRARYRSGWQAGSTPGGLSGFASTRLGAELFLPLRVVDGARLVTAIARLYVRTAHGDSLPVKSPRIRVLRVDALGTATPMTTTPADGFASFAGWAFVGIGFSYDPNRLHSFGVTCDTANVIDASAFTYVAHLVEEDGENAVSGNVYADVACTFDQILDLRPQ